MVSEQRKSYDETDWLDDRQHYYALDALLTAYIHTIRIYEDHCMYKSAIFCAFDALEICEDADDKFEFLSVIMHNYAQIQDVDHAEELYQSISKTEFNMDADILLPFSVLYFTLGNYQESFEVLSELVMNNEDTIDFILDWKEGSECIDEKMYDHMDFYGEGYFTYDTFAVIWENYADFYRDREAYFECGLLV